MKICIINGPNINLIGTREPGVYGNKPFEEFFQELNTEFETVELDHYQSNVEGEIVNKLHEVGFSTDGILLNAAGYTHTSVAITDAVAAITTPVIEVHISNVFAREDFRKTSLISTNCKGIITGLGLEVYRLGLNYFCSAIK